MMSYKAEGAENLEVWNKAQPYYGRQLAQAFGKLYNYCTLGDLYYLRQVQRVLKESTQETAEVIRKCTQLWMMSLLDQERWGDL